MKMRKTNAKVTQYEHDDYRIIIEEIDEEFHAWIYKENYCVSTYIIGVPKKQFFGAVTYDDFYELITSTLDDYENDYDEFMDEHFPE